MAHTNLEVMTSKAEIKTSTGVLVFIKPMLRIVICFLICSQSRAALWEGEGLSRDVHGKATVGVDDLTDII